MFFLGGSYTEPAPPGPPPCRAAGLVVANRAAQVAELQPQLGVLTDATEVGYWVSRGVSLDHRFVCVCVLFYLALKGGRFPLMIDLCVCV